MKSWVMLWVVAFATLLAPLSQAAVAIVPVERANVTEEEGEAIAVVFADAYGVASNETVIRVMPAPKADGTVESYSEAAQAKRAKEYIVIKATRLNKRMVLSATRFAWNGKQIFQARMTAASLDDIEPIADRMSKSLWEQKDPQETRTIHTVTEREGQKSNRMFVEKVIGIKTGFTFIKALGLSTDYKPMLSVGFDSRLEGQTYFLEVGAGFMLPSDSSSSGANSDGGTLGLYGELGGSYYLNDKNISPYVGGGVMPRLIGGDQVDPTPNLALYGQGGLMFFRESSSRLYADVRIAQNLTAWENSPGFDSTYDPITRLPVAQPRTKRSYPTELGISVGVGW